MKKAFILCTALLLSIVLPAHEFWLYPDKFIYKRGAPINVRFMVGENYEGENWSGDQSRVKSLQFYFDGVRDDCKNDLSDEKGDSLQFSLHDEGTAMVTFNSTNSFIKLEPQKFNAYLEEDGLTNAIEYRRQHNETDSAGKEFYQRSVKTIFQVGDKTNKTFKEETDLPLDIIPKEHPYAVTRDGEFKVRVLFMKLPLEHAVLKIWHRVNNNTSMQVVTTDGEGHAKFFMSPIGTWMVSTVKMIKVENNPDADWQSYWGSLTWGYNDK